jgi:hypothetical protein
VISGPFTLRLGEKAIFTSHLSRFFQPDSIAQTRQWKLLPPKGSRQNLSARTSSFSFVPDKTGNYEIHLLLTQGQRKSAIAIAHLTVTDDNAAPVAVLSSTELRVETGRSVTLDGRQSRDKDGDKLQWRWFLRQKPARSQKRWQDSRQPTQSFVPDVPGVYVVALQVRDSREGQDEILAIITALPVSARQIPALQAIKPSQGILGMRMTWSLTGGPFVQGCRVFVDGKALSEVVYLSSRQLKITVDLEQSKATSLSLQVENAPGFRSPPFVVPLVKAPRPQLWRVGPSVLQPKQRVVLRLDGKGFLEGARVFVQGVLLKTNVVSSSRLETLWTVPEPGTFSVVVLNPDGQRSAPWELTIATNRMRLLSSEVKELGRQCGVQTWSVSGVNFLPGVKASLETVGAGGKRQDARTTQRISAEEVKVSFDLAALPAGNYWLTLTNPGAVRGERLLFVLKEKTPPPQWYHLTPATLLPGTTTKVFLVGRELTSFVVRWQKKTLTTTPLNRSTSFLLLDIPLTATPGRFPLELQSRCSNERFAPMLKLLPMPAPVISQVQPRIRRLQDTGVTFVRGQGFHPRIAVTLDGASIPFVYKHTGLIELAASVLQRSGTPLLRLENPGGKTTSIRLTVDHTPVLETLTPVLIPLGAKGVLTLLGQNIAPKAEVLVGTTPLKGVVRVNAQRLTVPFSAFPTAGSVSLRLRNPSAPTTLSNPLSLTVSNLPQLLSSTPKALFVGELPVRIGLRGENLQKGGSLLLDGTPVSQQTTWRSETTVEFDSTALTKPGSVSLRWKNPNGQLSSPLTLRLWPSSSVQLKEIRTSSLVYFCGKGLRQVPNAPAPRVRFWQGGKHRGRLPGANSFSFLNCLFLNPSTLRYLPSGRFEVEVCQPGTTGEHCSNRFVWERPSQPSLRQRPSHAPALSHLRPLSPQRWDGLTTAPTTVSFVLRGESLGENPVVLWSGQDASKLPGVRIHRFVGGITVLNLPTPTSVWGAHPVEVRNAFGRSNTLFVHLSKTPRMRVSRVKSLLLHTDLSHTFQWYGLGLSGLAQVRSGGQTLLEGGLPLTWSSFTSREPYFLESIAWNGASRQTIGPFPAQLSLKSGLSTSVSLQLLGKGQWGTEPLQLQAIDDKAGYTTSGGLAPTSGQYVQWRLGVSGVKLKQQHPQVEVWIDGRKQSFVQMDTTSLFGWTSLLLARQDFLGGPGVLPIWLQENGGKRSAVQIATLMPANSLRLTKVTNATQFSAQLHPEKTIVLEVHGQKLSKTTDFFVAGRKAKLVSFTKDTGTGAEWVRIEVPETGLDDGWLPLWAAQGATRSNTLLVPSRRWGVGGVARWRSLSPLRVSQKAVRSQQQVRLLIEADGLTPATRFIFNNRSLTPVLLSPSKAIVVVPLQGVSKGVYPVKLEDSSAGWSTPAINWTVED